MRQIFLFAPTYAVVIFVSLWHNFVPKNILKQKKTFRRHTYSNYCIGPGRNNHSNGERELEPDQAGDSHQEGF